MTAGYAAFSINISLNAKGNLKEKSRIIKVRDETAFWVEAYRTNILSITFLDNRNIPNNVYQSWYISADGKGGVIANEDSSYLFCNMTNVKTINFNNNFDTSNVLNMAYLFGGNNNLTEIDVSSFNTTKVNNMGGMFSR